MPSELGSRPGPTGIVRGDLMLGIEPVRSILSIEELRRRPASCAALDGDFLGRSCGSGGRSFWPVLARSRVRLDEDEDDVEEEDEEEEDEEEAEDEEADDARAGGSSGSGCPVDACGGEGTGVDGALLAAGRVRAAVGATALGKMC